jgi:hypothetical protein
MQEDVKMEGIAPRESFVALFDILGFESLVRNKALDSVFNIYSIVKKKTDKNIGEINKVLALNNYKIKITSRVFSDTIFFYTSDIKGQNQKIVDKTFEALMGACYFLLKNACRFYLPLRGAITIGELMVSGDVEVGASIIDAYKREKAQDWIGCWIADECLDRISNSESYFNKKEIVRYEIPLKCGIVQKLYALNWLSHEPFRDNFDKILGHMASKAKNEWEVKRKYMNTHMFIDFLKKR